MFSDVFHKYEIHIIGPESKPAHRDMTPDEVRIVLDDLSREAKRIEKSIEYHDLTASIVKAENDAIEAQALYSDNKYHDIFEANASMLRSSDRRRLGLIDAHNRVRKDIADIEAKIKANAAVSTDPHGTRFLHARYDE